MKSVVLILSLVIVAGIYGAQVINKKQMIPGGWDNKLAAGGSGDAASVGDHIEPSSPKQMQTNDYDYIIGMNLSHALSEVRSNDKCSIMFGLIQSIESDSMDESVKHVDFFVEEWLAGESNGSKNDLQLIFHTKPSNKADWNERPFERTNLANGQRLILSYCPVKMHRLAVSDEAYFPSIRKVIEYNASSIAEASSKTILELIRSERNRIFAGYIIKRFSSMSTAGDVENRAKVLVELLDDPIVPRRDWANLLAPLSEHLRMKGPLTPATQDDIVRKLVDLGGGPDDYQAQQSILFLIRLIKNEKIDLALFLDNENIAKLTQNYSRLLKLKNSIIMLNSKPDERRKFEEHVLQNP